MAHGNSCSLSNARSLSFSRNVFLRQAPWALGLAVLAVMLLGAPGATQAAIVVSNTSSAVPWTISDGSATTSADAAMSGTESFTVTTSPTNSVLVVNYTAFAQSNTGLNSAPIIKWNGTQLTEALVQSSSSGSFILAGVFYLFDPTPAVNGSLTISGSGRDAEVGAYTLSGVNTTINPSTYGAQTGGGTVAVNLSGATPAGGFAAITGAFRLGTANFAYTTSMGPAVIKQWTNAADPSTDMASQSSYISTLLAGSLTITQSNNAPSRNVLAVAVFSPGAGLNWSGTTNNNWSLASSDANWNNTTGTANYSDGSAVSFPDGALNTNPINIVSGGVQPSSALFTAGTAAYTLTGGPISGTGSINVLGGGLVTLSNSNTYSGPTIVTSGTLQIGNGGNLGSISTSSAIIDVGTLEFSRSDTVTQGTNFSGSPIAGNGILVQAGVGTLVLNASNSYSGGTHLTAGTLTVGAGGSLGASTGALTVNNPNAGAGAAVVLNLATGASTTTGPLSGAIATPASGTNTATINTGGSGLNFTVNQTAIGTFAGTIAGAGNFTLGSSSTNTLVLTGANTYSGTTGINAGTLQFATPASLYNANTGNWTPGNITVASSATLAINVGGPNDFSTAQAAALLSNLSTVNSNGLLAGAKFGMDTTNATTVATTASVPAFANGVTYNTPISDTTGTGGGALGVSKLGTGTLVLTATNAYSGPTSVLSGELILNGANSGTGTMIPSNSVTGAQTILSVRNSAALGSGTANSQLAPITMTATGGNLSTTILEIGAQIGTDPHPGSHSGPPADFSYQVVTSGSVNSGGVAVNTNTPVLNGQISLSILSNNDDGIGFAAYNPTSLSTPRVVALYGTGSNSSTLQTLALKLQFGGGNGDHITLGSPTANNTLQLLNQIDFNGGPHRRWASIRGVGDVPEGQFVGAIINSAGGSNNVSFDGNGGLIFQNAATSYVASTLQINGGAVFAAASDPATVGQNGALGSGTATIQCGTSATINPDGGTPVATNAGAHLAFMTYGNGNGGLNTGVGPSPTEITNRNITIGGADVTYASMVLGTMTDDYSAMNGNIMLNEAATTPTTLAARNGGRVDFGGTIGGIGSIVVGNSIVEGDATSPGIQLSNNGTIVFSNTAFGSYSYSGPTTVSAGKLYVNGTLNSSASVSVASGATLGGMGSIGAPVTVANGGILEAGQAGVGAFTLNNGVTFSGSATIDFGAVSPAGSTPGLTVNGSVTTNGNPLLIDIIGSISGTGDFALLDFSGTTFTNVTGFTLATPLPSRANGSLIVSATNASEVDLVVTSLSSIVWTGNNNSSWDTTTANNWVQQGAGTTKYIDNPGDSVIFNDTAAPRTSVSINSGDVHPTSVVFANNTSTYTISGTNAIAGATDLQLTGTGTVIFLNTNTYTGATSIAAGATLQMGNGIPGSDGSISQTSGITNNGFLVYDLAGSQAYSGVIGGSGALSKTGPGTLILTNTSTFTGGTTISSGTIQLGKGTSANDGAVTGNIVNNAALVFNYFGNVEYDGTISGSGAVAKVGLATLALGGTNTFTGGTTVNSGTLQLASLAAQNSTVTTGTGGVMSFLYVNGESSTAVSIGGLAGSGSVILQDSFAPSNPVPLTVGTNNQSTTFSGIISGTGSLTTGGTGTLTLTNSNTYIGGTNLNAGTLNMGNVLALGASGGITFGGGVLQYTASSAGFDPSARIAPNSSSGAVAIDTNGQNVTFGTGLGGNQFAGLTKLGAGTLSLNGANTYSGNTLVSAGKLLVNGSISPSSTMVTVSAGAALGGNGSVGDVTVQNGGIIDVSTNNGTTFSVTGLTLGQISTDTSILDFSAGNPNVPQLAIGTDGFTTNGGVHTVTVNFLGSGAQPGTYTLATYSGAIVGTGSPAFVLGSQSALNTREMGALVVTSSAIDLVVTGYNIIWTGANGSQWVGNNDWKRGDNGGVTDFLPGDDVVFDDSAGTVAGGAHGNVTISGTGSVSPGSVTFNNNTVPYTVSGTFGIAGAGALTLNGLSSVTLSTSNGYSGGTIVNAGTLLVANSSALGTGQISLAGGALSSSDTTSYSLPSLLSASGSVTLGDPVKNGALTFAAGSGNLVGNTVLTVNSPVTINTTLGGVGASLTMNGPSILTLAAASNGYDSGTTINGGTLSFAIGASLGLAPAGPVANNITINGGVLQFTGTTPYNGTTLNPNRGITLGPAGGTINMTSTASGTFGNNTGTGEDAMQYSGIITGSGNLTVTGGTGVNSGSTPYLLELGAQNTYNGNTTINNAVVSVHNNNGSGPANILPTTTILNLVNNGWFSINNMTSPQSIMGLTGDATGRYMTTNATSLNVLTITPSIGQDFTFPGIIGPQTLLSKAGGASAISLTLDGSGTQTLTGANTYSGSTGITSGILQLGNGGNTGSIAASLVTDNSVLAIDRSDTVNLSSLVLGGTSNSLGVTGAGELVLDGPGTLVFDGTNTYTGGTLDEVGTLVLANNEALAAGTSLIVGNPSLVPLILQRAVSVDARAVPEPGTLGLLAGAALSILVYRRRRRALAPLAALTSKRC